MSRRRVPFTTRFALVVLLAILAFVAAPALAQEAPAKPAAAPEAAKPAPVMVEMVTSIGSMTIELWPDKAPKTVANFLHYAKDGFFDGTIFHRVIGGFVAQGGGYDEKLVEKPTRAAIPLEAGEHNGKYTIAMARTNDPNSATSQFFINLVDNGRLDPGGVSPQGYAVFGKVVKGQGVVDQFGRLATISRGEFANLPSAQVVIKSVKVLP